MNRSGSDRAARPDTVHRPAPSGPGPAPPPRPWTVVVTGASGGLGNALCRALAQDGSTVLAVGRSLPRLQVLAGLRQRGKILTVACDVTDDDAVRRLVERVDSALGPIDLLVHAGAVYAAGLLASAPPLDLDRLWRVNVRGPLLLTQAFLPSLVRRRGQVVFVASGAGAPGARPRAGGALHAATQQALRALADGLRHEVGPAGVRVLTVYPGPMASSAQMAVRDAAGGAPPGREAERLLRPSDVAALVVHALRAPPGAEVTDLHVRPTQRVAR